MLINLLAATLLPNDVFALAANSQPLQLGAQQTATKPFDMVLASCEGFGTSSDKNLALTPGGTVRQYLRQITGKPVNTNFEESRITVLVQPKYGSVTLSSDIDPEFGQVFVYTPTKGYLGNDTIVYSVEAGGKRYKVMSLIRVMEQFGEDSTFCAGSTSYIKRVSSGDGWKGTLQDWIRQRELSNILILASNVTYSFADLPATTLAQTDGEGQAAQITLDTTAAGYGWYIAPIPLDNTDDFLPTPNLSAWVAKAGPAATKGLA